MDALSFMAFNALDTGANAAQTLSITIADAAISAVGLS